MQISKFLIACSVGLCLVAAPVQGKDSPEAARLREALRQKMTESKAVEAVAPAPSTAPEPVVVQPEPSAKAVATETVPMVEVQQPPPTFVGDDNQAAHLRQVLRERMSQSSSTTAIDTGPAPVLEPASSPQTLAVPDTVPVAPIAPFAPVATVAPVAPELPPALPISGSKADRLASLLQLYKADQITPQQYHEGRAKVMSE